MKKYIICTFLVVILSVSVCVPAFGAGEDLIVGWLADMVGGSLSKDNAMIAYKTHWLSSSPSSGSNKIRVSYECMASAVLTLNEAGQPCQLVYSSAISGYVIRSIGTYQMLDSALTWNNNGYYYVNDNESGSNGRQAYYYCNHIDGDILYSIAGFVDGLDGIASYVTEISTRVGGISSYVTAISTKLDTFGTQLAYLDDIYTALNGSHYCLYAGAAYSATIPLSYRTAEQIVAILNTDYVGKKITYFASGGATTEYTISHAFIADGYIKVGVYPSGSTTHSTPCLGDDHHYRYSVLPEVSSGGGGLSSEFVQMVSTGFANLSASIDGLDSTNDILTEISGKLDDLSDLQQVTVIQQVQQYSDDMDDGLEIASQILELVRDFFHVGQTANWSQAKQYAMGWGSDAV